MTNKSPAFRINDNDVVLLRLIISGPTVVRLSIMGNFILVVRNATAVCVSTLALLHRHNNLGNNEMQYIPARVLGLV
jgi:hypothetical protein